MEIKSIDSNSSNAKESNLSFKLINEVDCDEMINNFCCGNQIIDNFLKNDSKDPDLSITYLLIDNNKTLVGFYSLICSSLLEVNEGKIVSSTPAIEIKMLAIDNNYQSKNIPNRNFTYAHLMLVHCIDKIDEITKSIGAEYIVLNSTPEGYNLYTKVGNFDVIDEDYLLPDWKSDPDAIRMAKQIRPKL